MGRKRKEASLDCGGDENKMFFACYLLASLSPRHKGHSYIGFTVNPSRRIRQHNGEITCGALRTKKKRPWEMVLCIYGFPSKVSALQFEWAWQHPKESLAVREAARSMKSLSGIANKIKLACTMLSLPSWHRLKLTVNFFSTKYMEHCGCCPSLPKQMKIQIQPMNELACYEADDTCSYEAEEDQTEEQASSEPGSSADFTRDESEEAEYHGSPIHDHNRVEMQSTGNFGLIDENRVEMQSTGNFGLIDENSLGFNYNQAIHLFDSPLGSSSMKDTSKREKNTELPATVNHIIDRPGSSRIVSHELEVIDLRTPSPDCRMSLRRKNIIPSSCSDIIDLTKSPVFIFENV